KPWEPDSILRQFLGRKRKQVPRLAALARDDKARALDLGMGYGRNAIWLAEQGCRVEGWEEDRRYVAEARRRARELKVGLVVRRGDFTKGKWHGLYEVIVISQALHQVKRSAALKVLRRAKQALAHGGRLFLLVKLTSDRHFQRVRRDPAWRAAPRERNTFLRPQARKRGHYHPGRPRTPQMFLSALEPREIRQALKGLRVRHWRQVVLRSDWEEEQPVTHTVAEVVAERR
ncbi:MAG: class I SAM-dependent methyltransferase, partial [Acidobacteria bacterium]|nr:class I SAM-dependent methyltransferase [Acidobacteriota bacterium]